MSHLRPDAEVKDGPTGEAASPSEADLLEARLYDLHDTYLRALNSEEVTGDERTLWLRRIETEMQSIAQELDRLLHPK